MQTIFSTAELKELHAQLSRKRPPDRTSIVIPSGTCCRACGSEAIVKAFEEELERHGLKRQVEIRETGCHGFCQMEPFVVIRPQGIVYQHLEPKDVGEIVERTLVKGEVIQRLCYRDPQTKDRFVYEKDIPFYKMQKRSLLGRNAEIDPTSIEDYFSIGGYQALFKALEGMRPEQVIAEVAGAKLRGRGGAGFPTAKKWELARAAKGDVKYLVCNADEGDPGAYMDRSLLEGNPHAVIEGMLIGAFAIGSGKGYIYVRDEYPLAVKNVNLAIQQARGYGLLGERIGRNGFGFEIEVERGAGAFVCGEETALIHSIEGSSGEPKQRPPYPVNRGLWGKPTNINNVETWANVPLIINRGAEEFASVGTETSKGTKIFALVGKINNTGLVEVPMGITLREIIYDIGGGIPGGNKFKAVQTGGPSGGCIPEKLLDLKVDYDELVRAGSMMGSGGMIVMDEATCMVDIAKYFLTFLKGESCGKCFSCREGIGRMLEIVTRFTEGRAGLEDIDLLEQTARTVRDASMCGLGQTAANSVLSTLRHFRHEYVEHAVKHRCRAAVCKNIISSPCQHTCPLGTDVPSYVALIGQGRRAEAASLIRLHNPLPNVCARVCSRPCESKCKSGLFGEPIAIRSLKRVAMDHEAEAGPIPQVSRAAETGKTVGIVGSGPAGLTAAFFLAKKGHRVTVYESRAELGGMLRLAIPDYRLPPEVLKRDLDYIESAGVEFVTDTTLGKNLTLDELKRRHDAVFLAFGAHKKLRLGIPGEEAPGVFDVLEFLEGVKFGRRIAVGSVAGIVGGGDAAIDAARTALRLGCKKVMILYRRTKLEMPADHEEIKEAELEGVEISYLVAPKRVLTSNGRISGLECVRMELGEVDESGRPRPVPVPGSEFTLELDTLICAIGQKPDLETIPRDSAIKATPWGTIVSDPETFQTGDPLVFAGGDVITGPSVVINAMAAGKHVAESISQFLAGEPVSRIYKPTKPDLRIEAVMLDPADIPVSRVEAPRIPLGEPRAGFVEVELCLDEALSRNECKRCLHCDLDVRQNADQP